MASPYEGDSTVNAVPGVKGTNNAGGIGVFGFANVKGRGVVGVSEQWTAVEGDSTDGTGVWGESTHAEGVHGVSHNVMAGVGGYNDKSGPGVWGESGTSSGEGVHGISHNPMAGVGGYNDKTGPGVWGESQNSDGVHGISHSQAHAGVSGANDKGGLAGFFSGNVTVTGTISAGGLDLVNALKQLSGQIQGLEGQIAQLAAQVTALSS